MDIFIEMEQEEPDDEDEYSDKYDENGNEEMRIRANDVDDQVKQFSLRIHCDYFRTILM